MQNVLMEKLEKSQAFGDVVQIFKKRIADASPAIKLAVLQNMSEAQFVEHRLTIFFNEVQNAAIAGYSLEGAIELALKESLVDLEE